MAQPQKPHPEAILCRIETDERRDYPTATYDRQWREEVSAAKVAGYCEAVPIVKSANGKEMVVSIEPQVGGVSGFERLLRSQRKVGKGESTRYVRENYLVSEWRAMTEADRQALLETKDRKVDPRDAEAANLRAANAKLAAEIEALKAAQAQGPEKRK